MAAFELFRAFQDGMVLQRDREVNIWGFAEAGTEINVKLDDKEYKTVADENGEFVVQVYTGKAGGPHTMSVYNASGCVQINDILYGDVYIISGQSNMQLPVERTIDMIGERLQSINYPMIREFRVPEIIKFGEVTRQLPECTWYKAVGEEVLLMSATGFNFAENVYLEENVPIGLINNSIGGTPIESHLPEELLRKLGGYDEVIDRCLDKKYVEDTIASEQDAMNDWYTELYNADRGFGHCIDDDGRNVEPDDTVHNMPDDTDIPLYASCEYDDSDWKETDIPVFFGDMEIGDYHGSIWFRREIIIPDNYNLEGVMLRLGTLIDGDETYVNGVKVGETAYMYPPRRYPVPDGVLKHGRNVIAIRVIVNRNTGGFTYGKRYCLQGNSYIYTGGYTTGNVISEYATLHNVTSCNMDCNTKCSDTSENNVRTENNGIRTEFFPESGLWELDLTGAWRYAYGARMEELPMQTFFIYKPSALYNGMMCPVKRYTCIAGLWYQGESNDAEPEGYSGLMELLIDCWREWFGEGLPFIYVGLPQFDDPARVVRKDSWAVIREEQRKVLYSRDNTAMAVTIDIGEANDLHPQTKEAVGRRLALAAEALVYGKDMEYSGPMPVRAEYIEDRHVIEIEFTHCTGGIKKVNDNNYYEVGILQGVSGSDNNMSDGRQAYNWVRLENSGMVRIVSDNIIEISVSSGIYEQGTPAAVRYCYSNCPDNPPLYNGARLPAMPFVIRY